MNISVDSKDAYFNEIYEKYSRLVMQIAVNILQDADLAKDAFQSTFISFAINIDKVEHTPEKIKSYLLKTARNSAIDMYRKNKRIINNEVPFSDNETDDSNIEQNRKINNELSVESFENMLFKKYDCIRLYESFEKLKKSDRLYIKERYYDDLSIRQIAQKHRISEEAAKKRVYRSVKKLKKIFFEKGE